MRPASRRLLCPAILCAVILGVATRASAVEGLLLRERMTSIPPSRAAEFVECWVGQKSVVDFPETTRTIVDLREKTITVVQNWSKSFFVRSLEDVNAEMGLLVNRFRQTIPPELSDLSREFFDAKAKVEPTGRSEHIAGYPANEYAVRGGVIGMFVWVTQSIPRPDRWNEWRTFRASQGGFRSTRSMQEEVDRLGGIVMREVFGGGTGTSRWEEVTEVVEVRHDVPSGLLVVPDGFVRVPPPTAPVQSQTAAPNTASQPTPKEGAVNADR